MCTCCVCNTPLRSDPGFFGGFFGFSATASAGPRHVRTYIYSHSVSRLASLFLAGSEGWRTCQSWGLLCSKIRRVLAFKAMHNGSFVDVWADRGRSRVPSLSCTVVGPCGQLTRAYSAHIRGLTSGYANPHPHVTQKKSSISSKFRNRTAQMYSTNTRNGPGVESARTFAESPKRH